MDDITAKQLWVDVYLDVLRRDEDFSSRLYYMLQSQAKKEADLALKNYKETFKND